MSGFTLKASAAAPLRLDLRGITPTALATQFLPALQIAWELSSLLRARRMRRGALDVRAALFLPDVSADPGVMGSVGYDFASF